jgi:hypothetical protein
MKGVIRVNKSDGMKIVKLIRALEEIAKKYKLILEITWKKG